MTLSDRIIAGLKTMLLIQDQVTRLEVSQLHFQDALRGKTEDHERRLTRLETIIEIAKPEGTILRIAPARPADDPG